MKKPFIIFAVLSMILISSVAHAEDIWQMAQSEQYGKKAGGMLGRGLINAASCFVDLAVQTVEKTQEGPPIIGTLTGIGSGAGCTVLRAASGVLDIASFWVPGFNGIPVSRSYSNCIEVEEAAYTPTEAGYAIPQASAITPNQSAGETSGQHDPMAYVKK